MSTDDKVIWAIIILAIGVAFGYFWCFKAITG